MTNVFKGQSSKIKIMVQEINLVETDVDLLISLVKSKGTISVDDAAKSLRVPLAIVQRWVDFLVEEEILGIEYKFITPYLYLNKDISNPSASTTANFEDKEVFFSKSKARGLHIDRINKLWKQYLATNLDTIKDYFFTAAHDKGLSSGSIDRSWQQYYEYLKRIEE